MYKEKPLLFALLFEQLKITKAFLLQQNMFSPSHLLVCHEISVGRCPDSQLASSW